MKALERVQANGKHLLGLINDVLDLSKIEAGQLTLALEDYALAQVVQNVKSTAKLLAKAKGIVLTANVQDGIPIGRGDERRLTQVLLNLVGNAIKFTDQGSVDISARMVDASFEIAVKDTGPGIAPEDQRKIFEEFQQVDNSSTRQKGGSGLGLAISKRIVEMHGGTIEVQSVLGEGSTFRIVIPVRAEEQMRGGMTRRILLVEDTEDNREIVRDLMDSVGYELLEANDGAAGLAMATEHRPDLILMDIQLPVMDGYEVTRRIKADPALWHIPIIAVTSYALSGDEEKTRQAGCDGYVAKPFSPRQLLAKINQFLPIIEQAGRE